MNAVPVDSKQTTIVINGQNRNVPESMMLDQLLRFLDIDPARVAVEINKVIVRRPAWSATAVPGGSALEIVQFVGGG